MLSVKRLLFDLLIVIGLSALFLLYSVNENKNARVTLENPEIHEKEFLHLENTSDHYENLTFYVVGGDGEKLYQEIYFNVCRLFDDWKVTYYKCDRIRIERLKIPDTVLVFCDDNISDHIDLRQYAEFIERGGRAIMAGGIAEGYKDSYIWPVIGLVEKTVKENYDALSFAEDFLLLQTEVMQYDGYHMSTWIDVRDSAEVYVCDSYKKVPIVYSYQYNKGTTLVINSTMLSDSRMQGLLAAGIGALCGDFLYPILGTKSVFLDHYPMITYFDDEACMKLYGRTTEAFVRDVVWPYLLGLAMRNDIKYTASVNCLSNDPEAFPAISESLFNGLGKSALLYEHELAYAANITQGQALYENEAFKTQIAKTFVNYDLQSLVMLKDHSYTEAMEVMGEGIRAVRGDLGAKEQQHRLHREASFWVFPAATAGTELDGGNMLAIASILTSYGFVSHIVDVNALLAANERNADWDANKIQLEKYEKQVLEEIPYLDAVTLSATEDYAASYLGLDYQWEIDHDILNLTVSNVQSGQPFIFRTEKQIARVEGGEFQRISENYVILKVNSTKVRIYMRKEETA